MSRVNQLAIEQEQYVIDLRREFHAHPEVSMHEKETSARIVREIESIGLPYEIVGPYGVLAELKGGKPGKTIALRADMDALPITEDPDNMAGPKPVVATVDNAAHLCGHDSHVAMLLGSMKALYKIKDELAGTVLFCFEQAEETGGGIAYMVEALEGRGVEGFWGIHVMADIETGKISVDPGPRMAGASRFVVTVNGKGGHGSRPDQTIDPVQCAAQMVVNLGAILARELSPFDIGVVTVGYIKAGEVGNVIPETAKIGGTIRTFEARVGLQIKEALHRIINNVAAAHRCTVDIEFSGPGKGVINDQNMSALAVEAVKRSIGEQHLLSCPPLTGSESVGHYMEKYPGVFAFLGVGSEELGTTAPHHNPKFDLDESALKLGVAVTLQVVLDFFAS